MFFFVFHSGSSSCGGSRAFKNDVAIFPNPATHEVQIKWNYIEGEKAELMVYNSVGAIVAKRNILALNGFENIDVSRWTTGIYFVRIQSNSGASLIEKLIVQ